MHPLSMPSAEWHAAQSPVKAAGFTPRFAQLDKKVLRYFGVFEELLDPAIVGSAPADAPVRRNEHVRHCSILYYLEDGTIQVGEKRQDNSGMMQGQLIKRTHIPKPVFDANGWGVVNPSDAPNGTASLLKANDPPPVDMYTPEDFVVGGEVNLFGRVIFIYDCDIFTQEYNKHVLGRAIPLEQIDRARAEAPTDLYIDHVAAQRSAKMELAHRHSAFAASGVIKEEDHGTYMKFLQWDTKVLRFFCVWDDRQSMYGDQRKFVLRYYLADDTVDMVEEHVANSGRRTGNFLRRGRVPKKMPESIVGSGDIHSGDYFTPADLMVGDTVTLYNRIFFICGCDTFTRAYYAKNFGITDMPEFDVDPEPLPTTAVRAPVPAYSGLGTQEDSFGSVLYLVPKPPAKNVMKMLQNEKKRLRFRARFTDPKDAADEQRRFIITYFTADDTIAVYEESINNSGRWSGKFLERGRVLKPDPTRGSAAVVYYGIEDMVVGNHLNFNCHKFIIMQIDEFSRKVLLKIFPHREDLQQPSDDFGDN